MITSILLGANGVLFALIGNFLWSQHKKAKAFQDKLDILEHSVEEIKKDHPVLINADLLFSRKLNEINAQLVSMENQVQGFENKRDNDGGYQHAMKILEMGGNREEIVESCHLSPAEAEFLMNLQAYRAAMKTI